MQDQAGNLVHVVSVFKLDGVHAAAVVPVAKQKRAAPTQVSIKSLDSKPSSVRIPADNSARFKKIVSALAGLNEEWEEF